MKRSHAHDEEGAAAPAAVGSKNITVFCRLKPRCTSDDKFSPFAVDDEKTIRVNQSLTSSTPQEHNHKTSTTKASLIFTFDRVYDERSSQELVFEDVGKPLVETVCNGVNATILAYGTTASGKTYTMLGARTAAATGRTHTVSDTRNTSRSTPQDMLDSRRWAEQVGTHRDLPVCGESTIFTDEHKHLRCKKSSMPSIPYVGNTGAPHYNDGLLPRIIFYLFDCLERKQKLMDKKLVKAAAMEVYNDSIVDLATGRRGLKIHKLKCGQVSLVGLHEEVLSGPEAAIGFLERVVEGRKTAATCVNAESSRSHFVFWLLLQETVSVTGRSTTTRLSVVDLAGSERLVKTNTSGNTQVEGAMINKSLTCLGKVINCLATLNEAQKGRASGSSEGDREAPYSVQQCRAAHFIPYRDSKLTRVLEDSLGGNSHTYIMLTCSQGLTHLAENIPTLRFGQRARIVKNSPKVSMLDGYGEHEMKKDICRYQNYIRALTSWGEAAIVKLSDCTRSAPKKHCDLQSMPVLCKTAMSSRRIGFKRANTSTPCPTEDLNEDGRQAEVVDELLSGFPAPPEALQLDFTKDDMTKKIRCRLQCELISSTRGVESQAFTSRPEPGPAGFTPAGFAHHEAGEHQAASLDAHSLCAGPRADRDSPPRQRMTAFTAEQQCDAASSLVKENVECFQWGPRQTCDPSRGYTRHAPTSVTVPLCDSHPEDMKDSQACSLRHSAERERKAYTSSDSCSCERLSHQSDGAELGRPKLGFCEKQQSDGHGAYLGLVPDRCRTYVEAKPSSPTVCHERATDAIPRGVLQARSEWRPGQPAVGDKPSTFWNVARSWVPNIKWLQYLSVRRAQKIEVLRRATQLDDAMRFEERLFLGQ